MLFAFVFVSLCCTLCWGKYEPNWESLDSRPLPTWYDEAKFGIFMHWGVYSVPGMGDAWFWWYWKGTHDKGISDYMKNNYPQDWTYADFASQFRADLFDPKQWANIFKQSGAKYLVMTSKHHDGFTNFPSESAFNWNSVDVGPNRDLVDEVLTAVRDVGIHGGVYYSLFEFFNPIYLADKANKFKTQRFIQDKMQPEIIQVVSKYKPEVLWADGNWEAPSSYWNSTNILAWLYNESPVRDTVVTNDRWGAETRCKHGGFYNCDDHFHPGTLLKHKWEMCDTLDRDSWGIRRALTADAVLTIEQIIYNLVSVVSCGGNYLLNVGPTSDGRIIPIFEERLTQIGKWLDVNGEAIYATKPWAFQNDTHNPDVWYTMKKSTNGTAVYAIVLRWPDDNILALGAPQPTFQTRATMLGFGKLTWMSSVTPGVGMLINLPTVPFTKLPSTWAWAVKLEYLFD